LDPLIAQVELGEYENVQRLLQDGADANAANAGGERALPIAAKKGRHDLVKLLLDFKADPNAKDKAGRRALELAKDNATFEALKAGGATMSDMTQQQKNDLLIEYVEKGLAGGALMALQAGADVNHKDTSRYRYYAQGNSCLHIAAAQGSNEILRILLNAGAQVSAKNKAYNTALELAQNAQTMDVLKGAGATMPEFPEERKNDLLIEYSKKGLPGGALMALQAGADVNHINKYGDMPLQMAAAYNNLEVAKVLLANGAQVNAQTGSISETALHIAASDGREALAQVLLGAGADMNAATESGRTPLHMAAGRHGPSDLEVVKVLLGAGANINAADSVPTTETHALLFIIFCSHSLYFFCLPPPFLWERYFFFCV
jgi:ankyrin repeat protein